MSAQGEPHSWCCMLRGQVRAAGRRGRVWPPERHWGGRCAERAPALPPSASQQGCPKPRPSLGALGLRRWGSARPGPRPSPGFRWAQLAAPGRALPLGAPALSSPTHRPLSVAPRASPALCPQMPRAPPASTPPEGGRRAQARQRVLTAEVGAPPALRPAPGVRALAGVLGEGGAQAAGAAAQVLGAGRHVGLGVHQLVAGCEAWAPQGAAADAVLGSTGAAWGPRPAALAPPSLVAPPIQPAHPRPAHWSCLRSAANLPALGRSSAGLRRDTCTRPGPAQRRRTHVGPQKGAGPALVVPSPLEQNTRLPRSHPGQRGPDLMLGAPAGLGGPRAPRPLPKPGFSERTGGAPGQPHTWQDGGGCLRAHRGSLTQMSRERRCSPRLPLVQETLPHQDPPAPSPWRPEPALQPCPRPGRQGLRGPVAERRPPPRCSCRLGTAGGPHTAPWARPASAGSRTEAG